MLPGLGRGVVEAFLLRPNHTVIATVRNLASATAKSLEILPKAEGTSLIVVKIDSETEDDAQAAINTLQQDHGITHLDIVIANAGISPYFSRVEEIDTKVMREMMDVNAFGTLVLLKAVYPLLKSTADGGIGKPRFVAISTIAATLGGLEHNTPFLLGAYGASKIVVNYVVRRAQFESPWLNAFVLDPG
jgi:norsolorinic acid ketoreductase